MAILFHGMSYTGNNTMISTVEEFSRLLASQNPEDYQRLRSDIASDEVWSDILEKLPEATIWVVRNKTIPLGILRILAKHEDVKIRWEVATKRKLDEELFEILSKDNNETVRVRVAYNKRTPKNILERLAGDGSKLVAEIASSRLENMK